MDVNFKTLALNSPDYPDLLKQIPDAPVEIFVSGKPPEQNSVKIAIVGTRKATNNGRVLAKQVASKIASLGITIVSGLAMGIDTAAHEGALENSGTTIAVLANGLDKIYPAQNENLAKRIIDSGGCLISEYPIGTPSFKNQFLERNRIISGLCQAVIIIEAPERSGSLATARFAAEQGREVLVFPGPHEHENYRGSHQLIRDGARLVASLEDVLEDLNIATKYELDTNIRKNDENLQIKDENQLLIIQTIQEAGEPLSVDKIIKLAKLDPQVANTTIAMLTISGLIKETEKGYTI